MRVITIVLFPILINISPDNGNGGTLYKFTRAMNLCRHNLKDSGVTRILPPTPYESGWTHRKTNFSECNFGLEMALMIRRRLSTVPIQRKWKIQTNRNDEWESFCWGGSEIKSQQQQWCASCAVASERVKKSLKRGQKKEITQFPCKCACRKMFRSELSVCYCSPLTTQIIQSFSLKPLIQSDHLYFQIISHARLTSDLCM